MQKCNCIVYELHGLIIIEISIELLLQRQDVKLSGKNLCDLKNILWDAWTPTIPSYLEDDSDSWLLNFGLYWN